MWTLIRVITAASCSEIAQDSGQTPEQLLWDLGRSLRSLKGVRRRIRGSREVPGPASSGTRRGGRCRPDRRPCEQEHEAAVVHVQRVVVPVHLCGEGHAQLSHPAHSGALGCVCKSYTQTTPSQVRETPKN